MPRIRFRRPSHTTVVAYLALFAAVSTGGAYAANTVFSTDIVDGEVKSVDIANNSIHSGDVLDNTINTFDVHSFLGVDVVDGTLTGADVADTSSLGSQDIGEEGLFFNNTLIASDIASQAIGSDEVANDSLLQSDIQANAVTSDEVLDNSLTGTDINEGALSMPPTTTTTFAPGSVTLPSNDTLTQVASRSLPAGAYSVTATVHGIVNTFFEGDHTISLYCELRNGSAFMGTGTDRSVLLDAGQIDRTIPIVGGAQVPAGGGTVSLWCRSQANEAVEGQMMITRIDGFF